MGFSELQSSCEVKETVMRKKGGYTLSTSVPRSPLGSRATDRDEMGGYRTPAEGR